MARTTDRSRGLLFWGLACVWGAACATQPKPGDPCSDEGKLTCLVSEDCRTSPETCGGNSFVGVECRKGTYYRVDCRDTGSTGSSIGCVQHEFDATCGSSLAFAGDGCWSAKYEGKSMCDHRIADQRLVCTNGTWVAEPCAGCMPFGGGGDPQACQ